MPISLRERFRFNKISILIFVGLVTAISNGLFNTIWALFLDSFLHNESYVGLFSTIISIATLISFIVLVPLIEKYQENKIYFYSVLFSILILFLYPLFKSIYVVLILSLIYTIFGVLRAESFGIMYRKESKIKSLGKNEGLVYTLSNVGWLIGPLIGVLLLKTQNFSITFIVIALLVFIALLIFSFYKHNYKKYKIKYRLLTNIKLFFKNKDLRNLYISGIGVSMWLGFVFIYIPLYMVRHGIDKSGVGLFFFVLILPLLIEYTIGKKSDKLGTKSFITSGYFIISIFSIIAFISNNIYPVLSSIILASFGVAFLGPTKEISFFKLLNKQEEERYYGIFLTHLEVGLLLGKFIPALLLLFLPFNYIFIVLAIIMFAFGLVSLNLKNI